MKQRAKAVSERTKRTIKSGEKSQALAKRSLKPELQKQTLSRKQTTTGAEVYKTTETNNDQTDADTCDDTSILLQLLLTNNNIKNKQQQRNIKSSNPPVLNPETTRAATKHLAHMRPQTVNDEAQLERPVARQTRTNSSD